MIRVFFLLLLFSAQKSLETIDFLFGTDASRCRGEKMPTLVHTSEMSTSPADRRAARSEAVFARRSARPDRVIIILLR